MGHTLACAAGEEVGGGAGGRAEPLDHGVLADKVVEDPGIHSFVHVCAPLPLDRRLGPNGAVRADLTTG
ncbi:hypothetical protein GCM10027570_12440 [Streptomonospora sediminis]